MNEPFNSGRARVTLADLIELNDEIASLVQSGIPLELGLKAAAGDIEGRLGELTNRMAARMSGGASLSDALAAEGARVPAVYRAMVETGLKAGRLPQTLESLTALARSMLDLRRRIRLAFLYPALVLVLAYSLFVVFVVAVAPSLLELYRSTGIPVGRLLEFLGMLRTNVVVWAPTVPAVVIVLSVVWIISRSFLLPSRGVAEGAVGPAADLLPGLSSIISNFHRGKFCETLAMLIENSVPLPEALQLSADTIGDRRITADVKRLTADVRAGKSLGEGLLSVTAFPPFMRWMMSAGEKQGGLASSLRQVADIENRRAANRAEWFKLVVPVAASVLIGGGATLAYGLTLFIPLKQLVSQLGLEPYF